MRYYFAPGQLAWGGDAAEHILYTQIAAKSFAVGEWPIWTNYLAGGSPYLQFYGFLFFYISGAVGWLLGDVFTSMKLVGGLSHALSGPAMYLLVRTATRSPLAGWVAGLAFVLSFWHAQQIVVMGRWPISLFYVLLPLPFFAFELSRVAFYRVPAMVLGAVALACLAFTHPGYGFWATLFYMLYIGLRVFVRSRTRRSRQWLYGGLWILAGGLVCGAYLTLPMWAERGHTGLATGVSLSGVQDPGWQQLFVWSNFRWRFDTLPLEQRHWYGGYLGLSLLILAIGGLWAARKRIAEPVWVSAACMSVSLTMVLAYRTIETLPMVATLNAGRYLLFVVFFLAYTVGAGLPVLARLLACRGNGLRVYSAAIIIIIADLGPTTFQQPYLHRNDPSPVGYPVDLVEEFAAHSAKLPAGELPGYRLYPTTEKVHPFSAIGWLVFKTGIPHMHSLFLEAPRAYNNTLSPWRRLLDGELDLITNAEALQAHPDYEFIYGGAVLQNLRYLLSVQDQGQGQPKRHTRMGWADSTPVLAASRIMPFPAAEFVEARENGEMEKMIRSAFPNRTDITALMEVFPLLWTIRTTAPRPERLKCDVLVLNEGGESRDLRTNPQIELLHHRVWNQRVEIKMQTDAASFVRLAYAYYPYLQVLVNGADVEVLQTKGGFIALELPAGQHRIELVPYLSPLRQVMLACLAGLGFFAGGLLWRWRRGMAK